MINYNVARSASLLHYETPRKHYSSAPPLRTTKHRVLYAVGLEYKGVSYHPLKYTKPRLTPTSRRTATITLEAADAVLTPDKFRVEEFKLGRVWSRWRSVVPPHLSFLSM